MKAAAYKKYGPPEVIQILDIPKPMPQDDEVLVRIFASTMNRTDCGFRKPEYPVIIRAINGLLKPRITVLGSEFSGVIEEVGKKVTTFKAGDKVFGMSTKRFGTHAEYICLPEKSAIAPKPGNMSHEEAAAVCDGLMLASAYINEIDFSRPVKILINGASGSIGSAAVQLARYYGASITAVCNTDSMELIKNLGAEKVLDYTKEDFTRISETYDIVFDAVGKSSFFKCRRLLNNHGIYFSTELGFLGQNIVLPIITKLFHGKRAGFPLPQAAKKDIEFYKLLIENGEYRAVIDRVFSLEQAAEAARYVETGTKTGNVVLKI
ncbi:NAD(P)-dependent alcohol dehydrogenase [Marispirochaeta sp.]|uniref:NAD(P)-dependent alcohol dehydrogenase n=1 Tax=Marispirochaeta sp. TaxID=2038653 RepID=UPI0029C68F97|nr:NAD(P)-dependent alcohol dehydrogenase [Marispirochaeta sp.]